MSQVPWFLCVGLLLALLIWREVRNNRIIEHLMNQILMQRGSDPIPEHHPIATILESIPAQGKPQTPFEMELQKRLKRAKNAVQFNMPGVPAPKAK